MDSLYLFKLDPDPTKIATNTTTMLQYWLYITQIENSDLSRNHILLTTTMAHTGNLIPRAGCCPNLPKSQPTEDWTEGKSGLSIRLQWSSCMNLFVLPSLRGVTVLLLRPILLCCVGSYCKTPLWLAIQFRYKVNYVYRRIIIWS